MNKATDYLLKLVKNENLVVEITYDTERKSYKFDMLSHAKSHFYIYPSKNILNIEGRYDFKKSLTLTGKYEEDTSNLLSIFCEDILGINFEACSLVWLDCLRKHGLLE